MKWPWHRTDPAAESRDASQARSDAEWHLEEAEANWPGVRHVAASLRDMSRTNHFGEAIERIMRGDQK